MNQLATADHPDTSTEFYKLSFDERTPFWEQHFADPARSMTQQEQTEANIVIDDMWPTLADCFPGELVSFSPKTTTPYQFSTEDEIHSAQLNLCLLMDVDSRGDIRQQVVEQLKETAARMLKAASRLTQIQEDAA